MCKFNSIPWAAAQTEKSAFYLMKKGNLYKVGITGLGNPNSKQNLGQRSNQHNMTCIAFIRVNSKDLKKFENHVITQLQKFKNYQLQQGTKEFFSVKGKTEDQVIEDVFGILALQLQQYPVYKISHNVNIVNKTKSKWNLEKALKHIGGNYKNNKQFRTEYPYIYKIAKQNCWFDELIERLT